MKSASHYLSKSPFETEKFANDFSKKTDKGSVICLWGELGAGKTTFVRGFVEGLGLEARVMSPTFTIVRTYRDRNNHVACYHIDLYRLQGVEDIREIGLDEILDAQDAIVLIEWPERLGNRLPPKRWDIKIETVDETTRNIQIEKYE